jgi:hypothetical protein
MLEREKTYALAGRKHFGPEHDDGTLKKRRDLRFHDTPPGQARRALVRLAALPGVAVEAGARDDEVRISYSLAEHSFEEIQTILVGLGFHLDGSLLSRMRRALIRYVEETQIRNMNSPERLIKKSSEVYVRAWEHHPHGDHDETPPDLRDIR